VEVFGLRAGGLCSTMMILPTRWVRSRVRLPLAIGALVLAMPAVATGTDVAAGAAHPQIKVGGFPSGIALDPVTDTIYVGNGTTNTLSLIDGKTCNAGDASGCGQHVTAATAGIDPIGVAVDKATNSVYVANFSGTVAVVDGRRCQASNTSGCHAAPATVRVGANPQFLAVDEKTDTIYVANSGDNTVSVIDGKRCALGSCGRPRASVSVGPGPFAVAVNEATGAVYVADFGAARVSVIDGRTCNARIVSGCRQHATSVNVGQTPGGIAVNSRTNTVYVTGEVSGDVSVIDGTTCNARVTSGCRKRPVHVLAGLGARGIAINEATDTVYVANTAANSVSVIDGSTCNAEDHGGCGRIGVQARVGLSPRRVAVDEVTNTVYVTNALSNSVTMLNGRTCNGRIRTGCGRPPAAVVQPASPATTTTTPSLRAGPRLS
jgi:DNA-binding beta-propeller fold protein YncE